MDWLKLESFVSSLVKLGSLVYSLVKLTKVHKFMVWLKRESFVSCLVKVLMRQFKETICIKCQSLFSWKF